MDEAETSISVGGQVYIIIQSATGKSIKICYEVKTISAEYSTERLFELIDLVRAY